MVSLEFPSDLADIRIKNLAFTQQVKEESLQGFRLGSGLGENFFHWASASAVLHVPDFLSFAEAGGCKGVMISKIASGEALPECRASFGLQNIS